MNSVLCVCVDKRRSSQHEPCVATDQRDVQCSNQLQLNFFVIGFHHSVLKPADTVKFGRRHSLGNTVTSGTHRNWTPIVADSRLLRETTRLLVFAFTTAITSVISERTFSGKVQLPVKATAGSGFRMRQIHMN